MRLWLNSMPELVIETHVYYNAAFHPRFYLYDSCLLINLLNGSFISISFLYLYLYLYRFLSLDVLHEKIGISI